MKQFLGETIFFIIKKCATNIRPTSGFDTILVDENRLHLLQAEREKRFKQSTEIFNLLDKQIV